MGGVCARVGFWCVGTKVKRKKVGQQGRPLAALSVCPGEILADLAPRLVPVDKGGT